MAKTAAPSKKAKGWDSEDNEAQSINFKFGRFADEDYKGDRILGVLLDKRQVPNKLSKEPGAKQWLYEIKVRECEFHLTDKKGNPNDESTTIEEGEIVNVYGKPFFDGKMRGVKNGQVVGLKYVSDLPARSEGMNDTKEIKVFLPKAADGSFEMDEEVVAAQEADTF